MNQPQPDKDLGQHWLNDPASLQAVLDIADINPTDVVVEIGPGLGSLSSLLVEQAQRVVAVEFDQQLAKQLPARLTATNLEVVNQDIRQFDFSALPAGYKVVGNIPYYLTSFLIQQLLALPQPPQQIGLLIQKEVAERLAAEPGELSILGVSTQLQADVHLGPVVPAELFEPPPKVDSQVVGLVPKPADPELQPILRVVKAGFSQRRKKLANSLSGGLQLDKSQAAAVIAELGLPANVRAQELSLNQWRGLATALAKI